MESAERGDNVIVQVLGENPESVLRRLEYFKDKGYDIYLHMTDLAKNKALGRALSRTAKTGRYHDYRHLEKSDPEKIAETFDLLKGSDLIEGYAKWNTDVPRNENPVPVEYSDGREIRIFGQDLQRGSIVSGEAQQEQSGNPVYGGNGLYQGSRSGGLIGSGSTSEESTTDSGAFSLGKNANEAYMNAVKNGDVETQQEYVDKAARKNGYSLEVFHGTDAYFTDYKRGNEGIHLGNKEQATTMANARSENNQISAYDWSVIRDSIDTMTPEQRQSLVNDAYVTSQATAFAEALYTNNNADVEKYAKELIAVKADSTTIRKALTAYYKPLYIEAYHNNDEASMMRIQFILESINSVIPLVKPIVKYTKKKDFDKWISSPGSVDEEEDEDENNWLDYGD